MTKCYPIDIDIDLSDEQEIDFFLFQWYTQPQTGDSAGYKLPDIVSAERERLITCFKEWMVCGDFKEHSKRPIFIIIPELSLPIQCNSILESLLKELDRPAVIIAGYEYMSNSDYCDIVSSCIDIPEEIKEKSKSIPKVSRINAACIWIRDMKGKISSFVQPKLHLEAIEQLIPVYKGKHVFLFRSVNQTSGKRLNFCIQICSDFTSRDKVVKLRECLENSSNGTHLDFAFLLQMNPDQTAEQFKEGVKGFFSTPNGAIATKEGCIIAINNASEKLGKCEQWGRSRIYFPYGKWSYLNNPTYSYWLYDEGVNGYQAIEFRDSTSGIYQFSYKPHYLVEDIRGSGQDTPFTDGSPLFCHLKGNADRAAYEFNFSPIYAIWHWVKQEWEEGFDDFKSELIGNYVDTQKSKTLLDAYNNSKIVWDAESAEKEFGIRGSISTYTLRCKTCGKNKSKKGDCEIEAEPNRWCEDLSKGIKHFLKTYSLLKIGESAFPDKLIMPDINRIYHARCNKTTKIVFLWGCNKTHFEALFNYFLQYRDQHCKGEYFTPEIILAFNELNCGSPDVKAIKKFMEYNRKRINDESKYDCMQEDITRAPEPEFKCIFNYKLMDKAMNEGDYLRLPEQLSDVIKEALA